MQFDDDDDYIPVEETRFIGIGYGTFTTLMFFIFILFVWLISDPIDSSLKWVWRFLATIVCLVLFLLMVFAEKEERYEGQGIIVKVRPLCSLSPPPTTTLLFYYLSYVQEYDTSFNARTATFVIMVFFTLISTVAFTKIHLQTNYQVRARYCTSFHCPSTYL